MAEKIELLLFQSIIVLILMIVAFFLIRKNISLKFEKRIGKYSIKPIKNKGESIFDIMVEKYYKFLKVMRKPMKNLFPKIANKYEQFVTIDDRIEFKAIDYITNKFLIAMFFAILTIISYLIRGKAISILQLIINFIIGFFVLNIYLKYYIKQRKKKIETEILRSVIVMNNAFKAGKSIVQAIDLASQELPKPISEEFKKIHRDIKFGLSVDKAFERFAKRVDIEEVKYISSSLTILNKTGGNIIKVFSSIERTLFDKKKLNEELKNLTASSNMIVKILLFLPFIFVLIIYLLSPTYFNPLFESTLGYLCITVIFLIFIIYVWFLEKIMKVKV